MLKVEHGPGQEPIITTQQQQGDARLVAVYKRVAEKSGVSVTIVARAGQKIYFSSGDILQSEGRGGYQPRSGEAIVNEGYVGFVLSGTSSQFLKHNALMKRGNPDSDLEAIAEIEAIAKTPNPAVIAKRPTT